MFLPLALATAFFALPLQGSAQAEQTKPVISVVGVAEKQVSPDYAVLRLGLETTGDTVSVAKSKNDRIMSDLVSRLSQIGISKPDIQTTTFSVSPEYIYDPTGKNSNNIKGYRVSNVISVKISDTKKIATVIDQASAAGINQIHYLNFKAERTQEQDDQMVTDAIHNAQHKAQVIAKALGRTLGPVQYINISSDLGGGYRDYSEALPFKSVLSSSTPIEEGTLVIKKEVSITYAIL